MVMNLTNGVKVNDRYKPDRRELRHVECVAEYESIVEGPPVQASYPRRTEGMTDESFQRAVDRRHTCLACGKLIEWEGNTKGE